MNHNNNVKTKIAELVQTEGFAWAVVESCPVYINFWNFRIKNKAGLYSNYYY